VKRTISGWTRTDAGNIEQGVNSPESIKASGDRISNRRLIAHICDGKARFAQFSGQGTTLPFVYANDEYRIVGCPQARGGSRNSRRPGHEED